MHALIRNSVMATCVLFSALPATARDRERDRDYWSGFYGGMDVGAAWDKMSWDWNVPGYAALAAGGLDQYSSSWSKNSFIGGLHVGYQQKFGDFVPGIEFGYLAHHAKGSTSITDGIDTRTSNAKVGDIYTLAGRLGFAQDRWLGYVRAGAAWANVRLENTTQSTGAIDMASSGLAAGYVLGGGLDYALTSNFSVGTEYNFMQFSAKKNGDFVDPAGTVPAQQSGNPSIQTWTMRLNYRFN